MWRWDGARWVPSGGGAATGRLNSRRWIWWLAGGCALLLVLGVAGAAIGIGALVNSFQHGGFACLPSDFPQYPGASVASENTTIGSGAAPGDNKVCRMTLESNDDVSTVTAFYSSKLGSGDWAITSNDPASGEVRFHRVSRPATVGTLDLLARGQHTEIQLELDS
jgi:hypothetical protein